LSQGTYGARVGVPRIVDLLKQERVPATFFVPGWVAENRGDRVRLVHDAGFEVAHHGYMHAWIDPDDPGAEEAELDRGTAALEAALGTAPRGYRSPAGETSSNLIRLLTERGFLYDSSLMDDVRPYRHVLEDGRPGPVEIPWHWSLDDVPFMVHAIRIPRPMFTNAHVATVWKDEFYAIRSWGGLFNLVMHPQAIGRPSRLDLLRDMIVHIRAFGDAWFATCGEVAEWIVARDPDPRRQPINPFIRIDGA
jgi:peptidoglycan/xylan/chitin deacetylase (PgdA/CDA1 family)